MVDHRCTVGESGHGYPCYILKPLKVDLWSSIMNTVSYCRRWVFRCTAIGEFSGARSPLPQLRSYGINRWPVAAASAVLDPSAVQCWKQVQCSASAVPGLPDPGNLAQLNTVLWVWRTFKQFVPFSRCNWCLMNKPTWIISWTVNYCFRKLIINHLFYQICAFWKFVPIFKLSIFKY